MNQKFIKNLTRKKNNFTILKSKYFNMKKTNITIEHSSVNLISIGIYFFSNLLLKKMKTYLLLITFFISSFNVFAQTSSLISTCGDFVTGSATAWPYVLEATTISAGAASQASQTYTMNVVSLPAGGALSLIHI